MVSFENYEIYHLIFLFFSLISFLMSLMYFLNCLLIFYQSIFVYYENLLRLNYLNLLFLVILFFKKCNSISLLKFTNFIIELKFFGFFLFCFHVIFSFFLTKNRIIFLVTWIMDVYKYRIIKLFLGLIQHMVIHWQAH